MTAAEQNRSAETLRATAGWSLLARSSAFSYLAVAVAGALVALVAVLASTPEAATLAMWGVLVGWVIVAASHLIVAQLGDMQPVFSMMLMMFVRGVGAAVALIAAVQAGGVEPKTAALVALPIYLSMLVGEALGAVQAVKAQEAR